MNAARDLRAVEQVNAVEKTCVQHKRSFASRRIVDTEGREHWTDCPQCQEERQRLDDWHFESGVEGRFSEATFDTFVPKTAKQSTVLAACREYVATLAKDTWRPLWLIGPPGGGKTHLGAAIVAAVIYRRKLRARMHTARQIIRTIRATWRKDSDDTEDKLIDEFSRVAVLVVDEIGVGFGSEAELLHLLDVMDGRYRLNRPTVLISNLNMPTVQANLGERIFDRLQENALILPCDWPSHRKTS